MPGGSPEPLANGTTTVSKLSDAVGVGVGVGTMVGVGVAVAVGVGVGVGRLES